MHRRLTERTLGIMRMTGLPIEVRRLEALGEASVVLEPLFDLDRPEDLALWPERGR